MLTTELKRITHKFLCAAVAFSLLISSSAVAAFAADDTGGYLLATSIVSVNSGNDVSDEIRQLIDSNPNRTIFFPDGEYLVSKPILTPAEPTKSVSLKLADFAVIKATGNWEKGEAIIQLGGKHAANNTQINGSNYSLEGGIIDGSGAANGVSINSGRETAVRNVSIKNTVVGLHIMYGANSGSSDSDISGLNITGTGGTDSIGVLLEGYDNTLTNIRIGNTFTGVHIKSPGNVLRNIHPLYTSDYTDYQNSCGFLDDCGNNWYDYCYSDQFGTAFRSTGNGGSIYNDCYCYWYSSSGRITTAFKAEKKFNSIMTNFKIGFREDTVNYVLAVGQSGGKGIFDNLSVDVDNVSGTAHLAYMKDVSVLGRFIQFITILFNRIGSM